jgi:hypothetical protein
MRMQNVQLNPNRKENIVPPAAIPATPGVNAPHPNDEEDPANFFGDDPENEEEKSLMPDDGETISEVPPEEPEPAEDVERDPPPPKSVSGEALAGRTFSEDGKEVSVVGTAGEAPTALDPEPATAGEDAKVPPAPGTTTVVKNGPRGYVVIREIELGKEYLEHFLKEIEEGKDPHKVCMVLEPKVEARNPAPVLTGAFKKHYKRLGQPLRLAAIPLSMWNIRTLSLKPKVIDDNIAIED